MTKPIGDPPETEEKQIVEAVEVQEHRQAPPTRTVLRRAMWLHTFVLLSWALSNQQQRSSAAAAVINHANIQGQQVQQDEDHETEAWPSGNEVEHYRNLHEEYRNGNRARDDKSERKEQNDSVIVISLVDGTMAGLSRKTGETLWKQTPSASHSYKSTSNASDRQEESSQHMRPNSSKEHKKKNQKSNPDGKQLLKPLISTTTTTTSSSSGQDWKTAAVPSVDGRVYLTAGREASGSPSSAGTDVTATTTVRELVSRAPFVDARGRFYVGSRVAAAAALDRDTGEVLRVVSGSTVGSDTQNNVFDGRNVVWVGRVDYAVSVYDARTGETDVQFSASEIMSVNDMLHGNSEIGGNEGMQPGGSTQHAPRLLLPNGGSGNEGSFLTKAKASLMVATPNGNVALRNPGTGQIEWVANETFESTVAFAVESSSGASLGVDILPDATVPSSSTEYLTRELERQAAALNNHGGGDDVNDGEQTIIGKLSSGELFAMPLGRRQSSLSWASTLGLPQSHSVASSSSAIGSTKQLMKVPNIFGRQHSHHLQQQDSSSTNKQNKKGCNPSSPGFPGCLVGSIHQKGDDFARNFLDRTTQQGNPFEDNSVIALPYHPGLGYLPPDEYSQNLASQKHIRTFLRIMASWLPPTMALIFVLSFELGRRQRIKEERKKEEKERQVASMAAQNAFAKDTGGQMIVQNGEHPENSMRNVGVIQVSEEILGYGGHGTVVYKGMLEGRKVAVKRMLEAYHASADREISLLIESDGHPNVVRYFLKEVRGDFVYLALELCDLSLHDLIGVLGSRRPQPKGGISDSTKVTLYQIASGVRHLHSLRIVHRDLKPANILLAQSKREAGETPSSCDESVYPSFDRGEYVAKISDMGLGKQLAGQSSFGISTLANSSIQGATKGGADGTNIVGAGPGSVGWQAPEVMALRWSPESLPSRTEGGSLGGTDSFAEASPNEGCMTNRTSRSVDIFSLGCIFYCTLVPGSHPFGEWYEREANIMRNKPCVEPLEKLSPEAYDLVKSMIDRDPKARPTAKQICEHPFFWKPVRRLGFLCDVSDRLESDAVRESNDKEENVPSGSCIKALAIERNATQVVGTAWDTAIDPNLIKNVSRFRTYDPSSVRDCLRMIRNKHHHFDELPESVKERVGRNANELLRYFESRFPLLLMHCYSTCRDYLSPKDPLATKYRISQPTGGVRGKLDARVAYADTVADTVVDENQRQKDTAVEISSNYIVVKEDTDKMEESHVENEVVRNTVSSSVDDSPLVDICKEIEVLEKPEKGFDSPVLVPSECPTSPPPLFDDELFQETSEHSLEEPSSSAVEYPDDIVVWEGSTAAKTLNCRGWMRSSDEWIRRTDASLRKRDANVIRCAGDAKFRTRLCNHWDVSMGTFCPMRRKNKCVFAHGPVELRVKEGKRKRWGKLVDKNGNNSNPNHSGGEDTYGAARSIETVRKEEGKWNTDKARGKNKGRQGVTKRK